MQPFMVARSGAFNPTAGAGKAIGGGSPCDAGRDRGVHALPGG